MSAFPPPPFPGKGVTVVRGLCPLRAVTAPPWGGPAAGP